MKVETQANIANAAMILGVSTNTLRKYIANGMPIKTKGGRGKDYVLNLPHCVAWISDLKIRKLAAETTIAEIEAATKKNAVIFIEDALRVFTNEALAVKARLLAIPQRIDAVLAGTSDQRTCKQILTDELHSALEELSGRTIDLDGDIASTDNEGKK